MVDFWNKIICLSKNVLHRNGVPKMKKKSNEDRKQEPIVESKLNPFHTND